MFFILEEVVAESPTFMEMLHNNMELLVSILHANLEVLVNFFVILLEFMGLTVIAVAAVKSFYSWIKKDPQTRLKLAEGLAMALEFKLGSEILRTVIVRDMNEIIQVGGIIVLRAALTFLLHWEIKEEKMVEKKKSV